MCFWCVCCCLCHFVINYISRRHGMAWRLKWPIMEACGESIVLQIIPGSQLRSCSMHFFYVLMMSFVVDLQFHWVLLLGCELGNPCAITYPLPSYVNSMLLTRALWSLWLITLRRLINSLFDIRSKCNKNLWWCIFCTMVSLWF